MVIGLGSEEDGSGKSCSYYCFDDQISELVKNTPCPQYQQQQQTVALKKLFLRHNP